MVSPTKVWKEGTTMIPLRARLAVLAAGVAIAFTLAAASSGSAQRTAAVSSNPTSVVHKYFKVFNAGMLSGDFSALKQVYAPKAVLTQSNPLGETKVSRGLIQITAFYEAAYAKFKGAQWTQDSMRSLSKDVTLSYEHAGDATFKVPGRCAHLFVVKKGKIQSLDWITFYSGQK
jgi:SnoaL-like domain